MRWTYTMTLWTLGALILAVPSSTMAFAPVARPVAVSSAGATDKPILQPATDQHVLIDRRRLPEPATSWPWLAGGGILAILGVISYASRRRVPFGSRF